MQNLNDLLPILISPENGEELILESESLLRNSQNTFTVKNNIPVLLPAKSSDNEFGLDYLKHYEEDHKYFDYFTVTPCFAQADDERRVHEMILSEAHKSIGSTYRILDVGCGGAWVADYFCNLGKEVVSFDISILNVEKALNKVKSKGHYGVVGDALNIPFDKQSFDLIIASEVIEHIVTPDLFVNNLLSLLKKGGKFIITTPYKEKLRMETCIHCNHQTPRNSHLHSFDEEKLEKYITDTGSYRFGFSIFGNKALMLLRTYILTKFLPLSMWKLLDKLTNLIVNKPAHIMAVYTKK